MAKKKTATKKTSAKTKPKAKPKLKAKAKPKVKAKVKPKAKAKTKKATPVSKVKPMAEATLPVGSPLPNFSAAATSGQEFDLGSHRGKKIVLYFYPKDATPGCTIEGHEFTQLLPEFKQAGAEVYGISRDSLKSHESFKEKECFSFELLSDEDETLCNLFGVIKEKNMYGKKVMGIERSTFLIDADGKLAAEWRGVKVPGHAQEVLQKVRGLN